MHTFKDNKGETWNIDLTLAGIRRIEAADFSEPLKKKGDEVFHINFFPPEDDLFTNLITNPSVCFQMLWCVLEEEAVDRGIGNMEEFAALFGGDEIAAARLAFYEELPPFFPEMTTSLKALTEKYSLVHQKADAAIAKKMDTLLSEKAIENEVSKIVDKIEFNLGSQKKKKV